MDAAKPGAQIWAQHYQTDEGTQRPACILDGASQHYGAGLSSILCIQNFWRWRLAKDSDPAQFDRFWRQLFRYLGAVGRQDVSINLADQDLHPGIDARVIVEKQPNPKNVTEPAGKFTVRVENGHKDVLLEEAVELEPSKPRELKFRAETAGSYTISVLDLLSKVAVATRTVEIRESNVEFQNTGRDMESLKQWASLSEGLALKVEECPNGGDLVKQIKTRVEQAREKKTVREPAGMNGWTLALLVGLASAANGCCANAGAGVRGGCEIQDAGCGMRDYNRWYGWQMSKVFWHENGHMYEIEFFIAAVACMITFLPFLSCGTRRARTTSRPRFSWAG